MKISVIVPFYNGNQYLESLLSSIERSIVDVDIEIIIVNDSPWVDVILPDTKLEVRVIKNEKNLGIQGARINGVKNSIGDWILMLDQDDNLVEDGFSKQLSLTENADVVVGNGVYILGDINKIIYNNLKSMKYLIQEKRFIEIRNLIPSPGECLIKKNCIPEVWMNSPMKKNGADDWLLWLMLFKNNARFACNEQMVYIHNDAGGANLSADLNKMYESCYDMVNILSSNNILTGKEIKRLIHSIDFKYYQDTKQLTCKMIFKYIDAFISNVLYRITLNIYKRIK